MSGNNENNNVSYDNLSKKEQENISAQKVGETGARAILDATTGGEYEKLRKTPILGKLAKRKEKKVGKKLAKADRMTGGNIGKVAKPLNDSGAIDNVNKGMNVLGGGKLPNKSPNNNISTSPSNKQANVPPTTKPNFAKNGFNNDNKVPNGNSEGANKNRLRDLFGRKKKNSIGSKLNPLSKNNKSNPTDPGQELVEMMAQGVKRLIKMTMLPLLPFLFIIFFIFLIFAADSSSQSDMHAVDNKDECFINNKDKSENEIKESCEEYYSETKEQKEFYERVNKTVEEYKSKGKDISSLYISATYFILHSENKKDVTYETMDQKVINKLADGMLGGNSTYSEETFRLFLVDKFIKKYIEDKSKEEYEKIADDIFDYVKEYLESQDYEEQKCTTTTGGSCTYSFSGIHGLNSNNIDLSNLKVRLMSSSDCPGGTDNVALNENIIPFEEYVLGVGYGELGPNYNKEVAKVHLIAARSFALTRPYYMNGAMGVKYTKENGNNIIQLRSCVADQVYCNPEKGCSADYVITRTSQPMIYSGTTHPYVYQKPLSNYPNSTLKSSWQETMGMVGVDKDGKAVLMGYQSGMGNKDPEVWLQWANQGMDYKQIILAAYPEIKEIKKASCNNTTESTENAFLRVAKEIWTEVTNAGTYSYGWGNPVPPNPNQIDCSTYVDWVLYKYGYEDFKGYQRVTKWFVNNDLHAKYGWEEIPVAAGEDVTSKLKPGDILVRDPGNNDGHMNIIAEIRSDGSVWGYDCGDAPNWRSSKGGKVYNVSQFVKGDTWNNKRRPGKIIRVTNNGTGDVCETAESGEWSEWRQINAPWSSIPLGVKDNIGTVGCYVTSIAIQIKRSGAQTKITNFNPGTFVNEIKKTPGAFSDGGGLNWVGENSISNFVPGFKIVASHVALGRTKEDQIKTIQKYIDEGYYVVLNLDYGKHWVAVTGTNSGNIQMVDPGRNEKNVYDVYPPSSIVKINVYSIK